VSLSQGQKNASISGHRDNEVPTGLSVADIKDLKAKELSMICQITLTLKFHILLGFKHEYV
jgi:hypothetical protein